MKFKINIKKCSIVIIAALLLAVILYVNNSVFIANFEQLLYGVMKLKGSGASTAMYGVIYVFISFIIICPLLLLPVVDFGKRIMLQVNDKKFFQIYPIKNIKIYGVFLLVIAVVCLLASFKFFSYVKNMFFSSTDIFEQYYVESGNVDISFPDNKRNLIFIFAESLESSNVSIENGGLFEKSVIPNLEQYALDNINFSHDDKIGGAYQAYGSNWTAAAMVSQTSGIPLKVSLDDFHTNSIKLMNVTTLGDILYKNGYTSYLLLGSDAEFGGRKSYFENHNYFIKDYYTAIDEKVIDKDYYEWWGYEDSKLFEYAKTILSDISENGEPFNFTMLTADTHFTDGYLDKSCDNIFEEQYANSFYCSDSMISNFVEWIKEQKFYENTTIIIVGDHLTMQDGFYQEDSYSDRTIYNVFINSNIKNNYNNKNRVFTAMDIFPTTIAALGAQIEGDRLGLGTNLFSDKKTIPEMIGIDKFNEELSKSSHYYFDYIRK